MRKQYLSILKIHFRESLLLAREHSGLTQEEMAPRLLTSVRSYCALESGESCCGALTLAALPPGKRGASVFLPLGRNAQVAMYEPLTTLVGGSI